jgi:holo-[acyl-carrier protein] synthase
MNSTDARGGPQGPPATPAPGWQLALGGGGSGGTITLVECAAAGVHSAGVDLVDVARIRRAVIRSGEPFVRRVFGERERAAVSRDPDRRIAELAALFGVKESVVKAMGGMPLGGNYADICVEAAAGGSAWTVRLSGELARWARRHQVQVLAGSAPAGEGMLLSWALALAGETQPGETQPRETQPAPAGEVRS